MHICETIRAGGLLVELNPDDCFHLADALQIAAHELGEAAGDHDDAVRRAYLFDTLATLFAALALAGAAQGYMSPKEYEAYTLPGVRALWLGKEGGAA